MADARLRELLDLSAQVRREPTLRGFVRLVWQMIVRPLRDPVGLLLASAIVLLVLWGPHGELPLLGEVWAGWQPAAPDPAGRASVIDGIGFDQELISFGAGFLLLVLIPCALIKWVFKHDLRDYGLGLPERSRMKLATFSALFLLFASLPAFLISTQDEAMQATYPLYRGELSGSDFLVYEAGYLLFFVAIEFVFRGYLLLGLFGVKDRDALPEAAGERGRLVFGYYAIYLSTIAYVVWHLHKPTPELLGTLVWGPVAGAVVLLTRSIWPVVIVHWLLNVVLDCILR